MFPLRALSCFSDGVKEDRAEADMDPSMRFLMATRREFMNKLN
jgi:hypothetical protein